VTETTPTQDGWVPRAGPTILDASRLLAHDSDVARTHGRGGRRPPRVARTTIYPRWRGGPAPMAGRLTSS